MAENAADDSQKHATSESNRGAMGNETQDALAGTSAVPPAKVVGGKELVMRPWQGLLVALLSALVVWGAMKAILPDFVLPAELAELQGPAIAPKLQEIQDLNRINRIKNATLLLVILAFTMGLALTVAELLFRRDRVRAVWGGLLAGVIAGAVAIGAGAAGAGVASALPHTANPTDKPMVPPLVKMLVVQGAMLGIAGLGIGLAMSLPMKRPRPFATCLIGCTLGGLLAAVVFAPAVGTLMPHANTEGMIPESKSGSVELLWLGLVAGLIGLAVTGLATEKKHLRAAASGDA